MAPGRPNTFEALALDRAAEHRESTDWLDAAWQRAQLIEVDFEGRCHLHATPPRLDSRPAVARSAARPAEACFLGLQGETPWFALPATEQVDPSRPPLQGLREAAMLLPAFDAGLFAYAKALLLWHTRARYCGACGSATEITRGGHCRRCSKPDCRLEHYPRTDAAVIVLVRDGDRALIGRAPSWPEKRFSTLAGFVEPGESLEDALRREVFEEAGVRVGACHYHSSQPWPFPASLMVGYMAEATDPTITLGDELAEARWVTAVELLDAVAAGELKLPFPVSISYRLIVDWLRECAGDERVDAVLRRR